MHRRTLLLTLLLPFLPAACGKETGGHPVAPGQTVLAFGDSVTYGTGAGRDEDWPTLLGRRSGWQVVNAGVPGDTAEAARNRLEPLLEQHRPALVIVELGGNDFLRRRPHSAVKENLREIIRTARQSGAQVLLVAVPEFSLLAAVSRSPSDAPLYAELAKEEGIPLVPQVFSDILGRPELCADQIHPNAQGYARMAQGIASRLEQLGMLAPR